MTLIGQKTKMAIAVVLAVFSAFLLLGLSYAVFPDEPSQPLPGPTGNPESLLSQVIWVIQWVGFAAVVALVIVVAILLVHRVITRKQKQLPL